ncbi:G patch domain-containing protein 11 [Entophlyctis sp. JEL0112]|nr:G patch domain-containing protein 11 [Entophlyctis sp. JEL0112]
MKRSRPFPPTQALRRPPNSTDGALSTTASTKRPPDDDDGDVDDYLAMSFDDTPAAVAPLTYSQKRRRDIEHGRLKGMQKSAREKGMLLFPLLHNSHQQTEVEARDAGLKTSILDGDNKGFAMLSKMGFQKGMTLGKADRVAATKLIEPISVVLKSGHDGLGMAELRASELQNRIELAETSAKLTEEDFISAGNKKELEKRLFGDLMRARRALQQLDESAGVSRNQLWIPEPKKKLLTDESSALDIKSSVLASRGAYYKQLATDGEEFEDDLAGFEDEDEESPFEKLDLMTNYGTRISTAYGVVIGMIRENKWKTCVRGIPAKSTVIEFCV